MRRTPGLAGILTLVVGAGFPRGSSGQEAQQTQGQAEAAMQTAPPEAQKARAPDSAERAKLIGRWKLNEDESENAREKMRESMEKSGGRRPGGGGGGGWGGGGWGGGMGGRGGRGGGGWGGGRGPGGGSGDRSPDGAGDPRAAMRTFFEAPAEIDVTQLEPEVVLAEPDGQIRNLHPDGKKYKVDAAEVKTRWDGAKLLAETTSGRGGKLIESWSVDPEKRRLIVLLKMDRPRGGEPVTVKRAYDPLE